MGTAAKVLGIGGAMAGASRAIDRIQGGDYFGGGLPLAQSAADLYSTKGFSCFTGEARVRTRLGWIRMDALTALDEVASAREHELHGAIEFKRVLEVFDLPPVRIWHIHVGRQVIRTTAEHPFYVWGKGGKGWLAAAESAPGDRFRSDNGRMVVVAEVFDSGVEENGDALMLRKCNCVVITLYEALFDVFLRRSNNRVGKALAQVHCHQSDDLHGLAGAGWLFDENVIGCPGNVENEVFLVFSQYFGLTLHGQPSNEVATLCMWTFVERRKAAFFKTTNTREFGNALEKSIATAGWPFARS